MTGSMDFDAWDVEGDAEVGLTVVGLLMDIAEKSVAMLSAILTGGRLAAAGTTESLTWTGMREPTAWEDMAADARLAENEIECGIVMFCECKRRGNVRVRWRKEEKKKRKKLGGKCTYLYLRTLSNLLTRRSKRPWEWYSGKTLEPEDCASNSRTALDAWRGYDEVR